MDWNKALDDVGAAEAARRAEVAAMTGKERDDWREAECDRAVDEGLLGGDPTVRLLAAIAWRLATIAWRV